MNTLTLISLEEAARALISGQVGVIPTDTLYGLVARAHDPVAVTRLYTLKQREAKPGTIIAASTQQLLDLGVDPSHIERVKHLWPNPLSIETPLGSSLEYLHQGTGRQGFRVVANDAVRELLEATGPLLTSSANQPGQPSSSTVTEAWDYFGKSVDFYVDGDDLSGRPPSTIIKLHNDGHIEVIRQGAIDISSM
jgi:L-threonylcarbamoyladenylate synthase